MFLFISQDRFWRKNRHRYAGHACSGVDINRNFGNHWNYQGASQNVSKPVARFGFDLRWCDSILIPLHLSLSLKLCSEVYSGTAPNSEPETSAVVRYLEFNRNRVKLSLDVHSFGKFIFYPYGYARCVSVCVCVCVEGGRFGPSGRKEIQFTFQLIAKSN